MHDEIYVKVVCRPEYGETNVFFLLRTLLLVCYVVAQHTLY